MHATSNVIGLSDANSLPTELLETPQPVIGFFGLDCNSSQLHKTIWDGFSNNRKADRPSVRFKLLPSTYEFPLVKPKRQSYEWYHPKGILKRNWFLKHLHALPAVVVLFCDAEWDDPNWVEKQCQFASQMHAIKGQLHGRHIRLAIVLLQKNPPHPPGEDVLAVERIASLANASEVSQKMIFVLPYADHMMGYILRLESAFLEQAQSYYTIMSKQVRMHRDQLTSSHQGLKIRHQFKLGFFAEMRLDLTTAFQYFCQAYEWLEEIRLTEANCLEIKTVAGFLNYKMCKLKFVTGSPRDAITQFRTHVEKYRNRTGYKELLFEHYAWLSIQYSAFAELFCDAIKAGLPALQTQHPGIYYHKAAEYMSKRKEAFQQCCADSSPLGNFLPPNEQNATTYSSLLYSDFFGIRGSNKTAESINEQLIIGVVQECEKSVNHSATYITLLGQAMAQFKIYRCLRFRKKLAVDMAEECLKIGDYSKALTLYSLMLIDYRPDKWNNVFTQVLLKTLRSAFLAASPADFIGCSLEALSLKISMEQTDRIIILENMWKVFQKVPPMTQSQIVPELRKNWETNLALFNTKLTFDLDEISKLFECAVKFDKSRLRPDEIVCLNLFIRSNSDVPLKIRELAVIVNDANGAYRLVAKRWTEYDPKAKIEVATGENSLDENFMIYPGKCYKLFVEAKRNEFAENTELQIKQLEILMGTYDNFVTLSMTKTLNLTKNFKSYKREVDFVQNITACPTCYIEPIFHLVAENIFSRKSMLTNEYFKIVTTIRNEFHLTLENVGFSITVPSSLQNKVFIAADMTKSRQKLMSVFQVDIGDVAPQSEKSIAFYAISLIEGSHELLQNVWYEMESSEHQMIQKSTAAETTKNHNISIERINDVVVKSKKETIIVPCTAEFLFTGKFFTLNREPLVQAFRHEDFLFRVDLEVKSIEIDILDMFMICDYNITEKPLFNRKQWKYGQKYKKGEKIRDVRMLHANQTTQNWLNRTDFEQQKLLKSIFNSTNRETLTPRFSTANEEILRKTPTFIGAANLLSSPTGTPMNRSLIDDSKSNLTLGIETASLGSDSASVGGSTSVALSRTPKVVYNNAIDAFTLVENRKGFLNTNAVNLATESATAHLNEPIAGVYCVRWRRSGEIVENETKMIIHCVDIFEAPLNIYCYFDEKMYVKVPMTLNISLKNSTNTTIHLRSCLKNEGNFMFAGNTQLNISLFAQSTYDLQFNLYPLKAGWQQLPEFEIKYNTPDDIVAEKRNDENVRNVELQKLVRRWMPKKVFVLPMVRQM